MDGKSTRARRRGKTGENIKSWLIMLPGLLLMTFFVWEPLFESIRMSLYKTRNVELVRYIGLDNFISVMSKDDFLQALTNTFTYTFWSLLIGFGLPILLALLIGETRRGKGFFRTAAYLPNMLPGLAVIILWSAFFSGEKSGVLNILLGRLGLPPQSYLTNYRLVIPIIIVIATWKGAGATALIYMAGHQRGAVRGGGHRRGHGVAAGRTHPPARHPQAGGDAADSADHLRVPDHVRAHGAHQGRAGQRLPVPDAADVAVRLRRLHELRQGLRRGCDRDRHPAAHDGRLFLFQPKRIRLGLRKGDLCP